MTITVTPVNDLPVVVGETGSMDEGGTLSFEASALLANDSDVEKDSLMIVEVGEAVNGTVFLDGTTIIYEHDGSETTTGSFTYTVSDGAKTATAMVTVEVLPVDDPLVVQLIWLALGGLLVVVVVFMVMRIRGAGKSA